MINWEDSDIENPSSNFRISVPFAQELGLNDYFEYYSEDFLDRIDKIIFYCARVERRPWLQDVSQDFAWIDALDLSTTYPTWTPVGDKPESTPVPGSGLQLWDRDGTKFEYVSHHEFSRKRMSSIKRKLYPQILTDDDGILYYNYTELPQMGSIRNTQQVSVESFSTFSEITIVIPNLPFQAMLGTSTDSRILASLRLPCKYSTNNDKDGKVANTSFEYYGDLIFNTESSRSYLKITTDQQLFDCDVEARLIRRDGTMDVMQLPFLGEFQVKLRLLQTE